MSSLDSPVAPDTPAAAPESAPPPAGAHPPSPTPDWPPWTAPLALLTGLLLALFGALLVDIPAAVAGVKVGSANIPPGLEIADTAVQDIAFVMAAVILASWGGRRVHAWQFGLRPTPARRAARLVAVLLFSFLVFSVVWGQLVNIKPEKILDQLGANRNDLLLVLSAGLTTVVAPICEEILFRGYIFTALRNWRGVWLAAILTGLIFGGVHVTSAPALDLVPLAALGAGLCVLYWRTGSLYPCIAAHCLNNALAFGTLEHWHWPQVGLLVVCALGLIGLLFRGLQGTRLLDAPAPATAG
jgi:membrane protease YdiL (CAAX protease family)